MKYLLLIISLVIATPFSYAKIKVCTTTSLIKDLVDQVGGELTEIESLMGPGVDPHLYRATASDLKKLSNADIIFYNGLHLEGRMIDIFEGLAERGKAVYAVADGIEKESLLALGGNAGYDPHIWFDPRLWAQCLNKVIAELKNKDPANSKEYDSKGAAFKKELETLYLWGIQNAELLPKQSRILITSHDAYNYFGRAFGFQVIGVQGISTVSETGLADIVSTVDFIKKHKIKAIFIESSVSPAIIERISQDSGAKIGGKLFSDSLGSKCEIEAEYDVGNYIGMFKYNMHTIVTSLK